MFFPTWYKGHFKRFLGYDSNRCQIQEKITKDYMHCSKIENRNKMYCIVFCIVLLLNCWRIWLKMFSICFYFHRTGRGLIYLRPWNKIKFLTPLWERLLWQFIGCAFLLFLAVSSARRSHSIISPLTARVVKIVDKINHFTNGYF